MYGKWTFPELELQHGATEAQGRAMLFASVPPWLVERGAVYISASQLDVFDGTGVVPVYPGDTIELVDDETYGTVVRVTKA